MSYSELIPNFNMWEDAINDVHNNKLKDSYFYCYLDCINSFNDDESNY